jgi:phosphatidylinositol alpha-mannosyltransferase
MKIGLVCPYNIFRGGGVQEHVLALYAELDKRGHDVRIITPRPRGMENSPPENVIFVGMLNDVNIISFSTMPSLSMTIDNDAVEELIEREKFDIMHFHEPWVPLMSRQLLTRSTSVNVATFHAVALEAVSAKLMVGVVTPHFRTVLKHLDVLTAVSEPATDYARSLTDRPIAIIPNGIDMSKYHSRPRRAAKRPRTILYVGRLEKRKGVKYLLRAFAQVVEADPDTRLIIAGTGSDQAKLEDWVADNRVPNVAFLGYVSDDQKLRLLADADIFCSPALYGESFGIVLLEAMAMGCVTVAGDNPGYASVLSGRGQLSLVNPKDTDDFTRRLQLLMSDQDLRASWKQWAAEHIKQFDYPNVVDQYEKLYKKSLKTHKKT